MKTLAHIGALATALLVITVTNQKIGQRAWAQRAWAGP